MIRLDQPRTRHPRKRRRTLIDGPAIRRLMEEALQQRRRAQIAQRFPSGEWGLELETFEADQERERQRDQEIAPCW